MTSSPHHLRYEVLRLYKELLYMGREYPRGYDYFRPRLHQAFSHNASMKGKDQIRSAIRYGEYVKKELGALYYLKRYRTLKTRYGNA